MLLGAAGGLPWGGIVMVDTGSRHDSNIGACHHIKHIALDAVATFLLASCISVGWSYRADTALVLGDRFVLTLVSIWFFLLALFIAARFVLSLQTLRKDARGTAQGGPTDVREGKASVGKPATSRFLNFLFDPSRRLRSLIAVGLIICALWAPYLALMAPGNLNFDTTGQIAQFFSLLGWGEHYQLSDHHPAFVTFVYGSVIYACETLFQDSRLGILALILLQACAASLALSSVLVTAVFRWRVPRGLAFALALWSGLFPLIPLAVCSLSKDSFFSWVFVLFVLCVAELARTRGSVLSSLRFAVGFVVVCALMALTKKFGVYIVVSTLLFGLFACERNRRAIATFSVSLVLTAGLSWCAMPMLVVSLGGIPGGKQEMLSVPIQQAALTYIEHGEELSEEESAGIDGLLECETLAERYSPWTVDAVKQVAKDKTDTAYRDFLVTWAKLSARYPETYFDAWAALDSSLFAGAPYEPVFSSDSHIENDGYVPDALFEKEAANASASTELSRRYYDLIESPFINQLFTLRTWGLLVPSFFVVSVLHSRLRRHLILACVPIAALFASLLLGPVAWGAEASRYVMPFVFSAPCMVSFSRLALSARCDVIQQAPMTRKHAYSSGVI